MDVDAHVLKPAKNGEEEFMHTILRNAVLGTAALAVLLSGAPANAQTAEKCLAGKEKCVSRMAVCRLTCERKAWQKGITPPDPVCLTKCRDKFDGASEPSKGCFAKVESKEGCSRVGNTKTIADMIAVATTALAGAADPDPGYSRPNPCIAAMIKFTRLSIQKVLAAYIKEHYMDSTTDPPSEVISAIQKFVKDTKMSRMLNLHGVECGSVFGTAPEGWYATSSSTEAELLPPGRSMERFELDFISGVVAANR